MTRTVHILSLAVVLVLHSAHRVDAQNLATIIDLGTLGGTWSVPNGMNDLGEVAGLSALAGDTTEHAFLWTGGQMLDLGTLAGLSESFAWAVNNLHQVVGTSYIPNSSARAFLWENGTMTDLNTASTAAAGWVLVEPIDINDSGQIVGYGFLNGRQRAFLLDGGVVTDLGTLGGRFSLAASINRWAQVVGITEQADGLNRAFFWANGQMTDLGGLEEDNAAQGLNDFGDAAGSTRNSAGLRAMLWAADGTSVVLSGLGDPGAFAIAINNLRQIVGSGLNVTGTAAVRAILWQDGSPIDLELVIPPGSELASAASINNAGQVVGTSASGRGYLIQLPLSAENAAALTESLVADPGIQASLLAKINAAASGVAPACNTLHAAINQVNAQVGKKIPVESAQQLTEVLRSMTDAACQ